MTHFVDSDVNVYQARLATQTPSAELSSIYSMIPSMVRSRIPVLTSLRRSVRAATTRQPPMPKVANADNSRRPDLGRSNSVLSSAASSRSESPEPVDAWALSRGGMNVRDRGSGIDWDTAAAGVRLWLDARNQAGNNVNANPTLLRRMHIESLRYMQMALPPDLGPSELEVLRESLPRQLQLMHAGDTYAEVAPPRPTNNNNNNVLRQGVSRAVCMLVTFLVLLVPILTAVLNRMLRYERDHHLSERILSNGINVADALGERGLDVRDAMVKFGQGRVGASLLGASVWFADGLLGGVNDGIVQSTTTWRAR